MHAPTEAETRRLRILAAIRDVPTGRTASYGQIARRAGFPRCARLVARILSDAGEALPWHRIVRADGRIAFRRDRRPSTNRSRACAAGRRGGERPGAADGRRGNLAGPGAGAEPRRPRRMPLLSQAGSIDMFDNVPPITRALLIANVLLFLATMGLGEARFLDLMLWPMGDFPCACRTAPPDWSASCPGSL